jgi:hypothetical protein
MRAQIFVLVTSLAFGLLLVTSVSYSQTPTPSLTPVGITAPPTPVRIIYAGKLRGYFRAPSLQAPNDSPGCRSGAEDSEAARTFLAQRQNFLNAILVGTGDNFSPQLESRMFFPAPRDSGVESGKYAPGNKELYAWDKSWVFYREIKGDLERRIENGIATIPTDNVGCFLSAARFAAVVPGKHDFYFGAERVRQLARFMAGLSRTDFLKDYNLPPDYYPPQMLGANLVIKSSRITGAAADVTRPKSITKWEWPDNLSPVKFKNGKTVYPWFSTFRVKSKDDLSQHIFYICQLSGRDDQPIGPDGKSCRVAQAGKEDKSDDGVNYLLSPDPDISTGKRGHYATLVAGKNYALCVRDPQKKNHCLRLSVHVPFFTFPRSVSSITGDYTDPDPYVLLPNAQRENEIAIFGVVDKNLGERVGVLNFSWLNVSREFKTVIGVEDPAEALSQQLDYFEQKYKSENDNRAFTGLKILLAQMSPETARVFAARFPEFEIVVTGADDEQSTSEVTQTSVWNAVSRKGSFVAVPQSGFNGDKGLPRISLGLIEASRKQNQTPDRPSRDVSLVGTAQPSLLAETKPESATVSAEISSLIAARLRTCFPHRDRDVSKLGWNAEGVKMLTLCAIRERTGADVALLQKRDLFAKGFSPVTDPQQLQQALDRIIWKGDLLTLLYVPGGAIKKAMELSNKFNTEDDNLLSLADEGDRGLQFLGVFHDGEQFLINETPIDDKKIYAVATSDYIGAGDTGYPDFKAAALNPKTLAGQFPEILDVISAVVCRTLFQTRARADMYCLPPLERGKYLDTSIAEGPPPKEDPNLIQKAWDLVPFKVPPPDSKLPIFKQPLQEVSQQRPIWKFSLRNFSFGFNALTKNLTDAQIAAKFSGNPTPGVTARKNSSVIAQLDTRVSRSSHQNELFFAFGADYKQTSSGDVLPSIVQSNNRATSDLGLIRSLRGGRSQTRVGVALYLHSEAPLQKPFATFTLGTQDRLRIAQERNVSILPRVGLRWQHRSNSFEGGFQAGREINAFGGYRFDTQGTIVECLPNSTESFSGCITRLSKLPTPAITKDSIASAILNSRPRSGVYSRINFTVPFGAKVRYVLTEEGDLFFNFHGDTAIDTRFRDISTHSLKFVVWPSLSIGPTLRLLLYQNKVNGDFLLQKQFGFETSLSFDLFNRREKMVQIRHKP